MHCDQVKRSVFQHEGEDECGMLTRHSKGEENSQQQQQHPVDLQFACAASLCVFGSHACYLTEQGPSTALGQLESAEGCLEDQYY